MFGIFRSRLLPFANAIIFLVLSHHAETSTIGVDPESTSRSPRMDRFNSVLELAYQMGRKPKLDGAKQEDGILTTRDFLNRWTRGPGKALSEKTLPLDRAVADHLKRREGLAPAYIEANSTVSSKPNASIFFQLYGDGPQKVIMIMGLSASHSGWEYILPLLAPPGSPYQICVFDNRGIGKSYAPNISEQYSIEIFAKDTIQLADFLGWNEFHLVGFSMGGMITQQVLSMVPERLLTVALLATSARRTVSEQIPPVAELGALISWAMARSKEEKALADLRLHFDDAYLDREFVKGTTIRDFWNYVYLSERADEPEPQPWHGFKGQMSALLAFKMSKTMFAKVRSEFRGKVLVMHGTKDRIINTASGKNLHDYLVKGLMRGVPGLDEDRCKYKTVEAGHFLPIQKRREVATELLELWGKCQVGEAPPRLRPEAQTAAGRVARWIGSVLHLE